MRDRELKLKVHDPAWNKKEKERHRLKYHRLNYKDKHKPTPEAKKLIIMRYKEKYPEKQLAKQKSGCLKPQISGNELHHWNYNKEHYKDVIELTILQHNKAHRYMVYDQERMMYRRADNNELLDTKLKHMQFIDSLKNLD